MRLWKLGKKHTVPLRTCSISVEQELYEEAEEKRMERL